MEEGVRRQEALGAASPVGELRLSSQRNNTGMVSSRDDLLEDPTVLSQHSIQDDSLSLSQHALLDSTNMENLSQHPLPGSMWATREMTLSQHPLPESVLPPREAEDFTLSQYSFSESKSRKEKVMGTVGGDGADRKTDDFLQRLEPMGVEGSGKPPDHRLSSQGDNTGMVSSQDDLLEDPTVLSQHSIQDDSLSLSQHALLDSTNMENLSQHPLSGSMWATREMTLSQHPLPESVLPPREAEDFTLSQYSFSERKSRKEKVMGTVGGDGADRKTDDFLQRLEPMGVEGSGKPPDHQQWHTLEETMDQTVSSSNLSQDPVESAMVELSFEDTTVKTAVAHLSQELSKGCLILSQHPLADSSNATALTADVESKDAANAVESGSGSLSQHLFSETEGSGISTNSQTFRKDFPTDMSSKTTQDRTNTSYPSKETDSTIGSIKFPPFAQQSISVGDSFLEKRPIGSSTPSSSRQSGFLSEQELSCATLDNEPPSRNACTGSSDRAPSQNSARDYIVYPPDLTSAPPSEGASSSARVSDVSDRPVSAGSARGTLGTREPTEVVQAVSMEDYMSLEERTQLVGTDKENPTITKEERDTLFSDIYKAPDELTVKKTADNFVRMSEMLSLSKSSLTGSDKQTPLEGASEVTEKPSEKPSTQVLKSPFGEEDVSAEQRESRNKQAEEGFWKSSVNEDSRSNKSQHGSESCPKLLEQLAIARKSQESLNTMSLPSQHFGEEGQAIDQSQTRVISGTQAPEHRAPGEAGGPGGSNFEPGDVSLDQDGGTSLWSISAADCKSPWDSSGVSSLGELSISSGRRAPVRGTMGEACSQRDGQSLSSRAGDGQEDSPSELSGVRSLQGEEDNDQEEDAESVSSNLTERVAALLSEAPLQEDLSDSDVPPRIPALGIENVSDDLPVQQNLSRPTSRSDSATPRNHTILGQAGGNAQPRESPLTVSTRLLESPHSQHSDTSATSYRELPASIPHHFPPISTIKEASFEERSSSRASSTGSNDTLDQDVQKILQKYGKILSEDDAEDCKDPLEGSHRMTPAGSIADSEDTTLTSRVSRLLHGSDSHLEKSYLYEDPSRSMTIPMASGSTTRSDTPPVTVTRCDISPHSSVTCNSDVSKGTLVVKPRSRESSHSEASGVSVSKQSGNEDALAARVRHLLGDSGEPAGGSVSSGRSSRGSSINYDVLQQDLEEIQHGLAILQQGELSLGHLDARSGGTSRRMSDASEDTVSKVTDSEIGTPRKFSWDYGDLRDEGDHDGRFVTSRTQLQDQEGNHQTRQEPEGISGKSPTSQHSQRTATTLSSKTPPESEKSAATVTLTESKYTRIARELEKETSPQRTIVDNLRRIDDRWSGAATIRSSVGRSYDSLTRSALDHEVENTFTGGLDDSQHSLSQQVKDIMERESPPRQAYRYLEEAETSLRHAQLRRDSRLHASEGDLTTTSPSFSTSPSFHMTPIPSGAFSAFENARTFLTTKLDRMTSAKFDTSVELRSPLKHQLEQQIAPTDYMSLDCRDTITDRLRSEAFHTERGGPVEVRLEDSGQGSEQESSTLTREDLGGHRSSRSSEGRQHDYRPPDKIPGQQDILESTRPAVTMQDYINGTHRNTLAERLRAREMAEAEARKQEQEELRQKTTDRLSRGKEEQTPPSVHREIHQTPTTGDSPGSAASGQTDPASGQQMSSQGVNLRPYRLWLSLLDSLVECLLESDHLRPPGSQELYYVESGTDDGNVSVTNSETTVESTHLGSDDARAPSFPKQWLGSRSDPPSNSTGIYSTGHASPQDPTPAKALDPIQENRSFEEARIEARKGNAVKSPAVSDYRLGGLNRSHHNNSELRDQSEASSEEHAPEGSTEEAGSEQGMLERRLQRLPEDEMRRLQQLEDQLRQEYAAKLEELYQSRGGRDRDFYNALDHSLNLNYVHDRKNLRDRQSLVDPVPRSGTQNTFGTPQRHQSDKAEPGLASNDGSGRRSDSYSHLLPDYHRDVHDVSSADQSPLGLDSPSYPHHSTGHDSELFAGNNSMEWKERAVEDMSMHVYTSPEGRELQLSHDAFTPLQLDKDDIRDRRSPIPSDSPVGHSASSPSSKYRFADGTTRSATRLQSPPPEGISALTPPRERMRVQSTQMETSIHRSPDRLSAKSGSPDRFPVESLTSDRHHAHSPTKGRVPVLPSVVDAPLTQEKPPILPRKAWSEGSRAVAPMGQSQGSDHTVSAETAQPRTEHQRLAQDLLPVDKFVNGTDINALWERFQHRSDSSDGESGTSARNINLRLSNLLHNPVRHRVRSGADGYNHLLGNNGRADVYEQQQQLVANMSDDSAVLHQQHQLYNAGLYVQDSSSQDEDDQHFRVSSRPVRPRSGETSRRDPRVLQSVTETSGEDIQELETSAGQTQTTTSSGESLSIHETTGESRKSTWTGRDEATLQSIPENTTLDSVSTTDVTSSDSNLTMSVSTRHLLPDDPKLLKLQMRIQRQRQKHEHEKLREQRRREKIKKLEQLLSKNGRSSDTSIESTASERGDILGKESQPFSPPSHPASSASSGKSTSTPSSHKGSNTGSDISLTVSEITSTSTLTAATATPDETTLKDHPSDTYGDLLTTRSTEADATSICECCNKKKTKSRTKSPSKVMSRSKSPSKVTSRSKSPQKVLRSMSPPEDASRSKSLKVPSRSKSPPKDPSRSESPKVLLRSKSPPKVSSRSQSPSKRIHSKSPSLKVRSRSPSPNKKRFRSLSPRKSGIADEELGEKPLKERHTDHASYMEFEKPRQENSTRTVEKGSRDTPKMKERDRKNRKENQTKEKRPRPEVHMEEKNQRTHRQEKYSESKRYEDEIHREEVRLQQEADPKDRRRKQDKYPELRKQDRQEYSEEQRYRKGLEERARQVNTHLEDRRPPKDATGRIYEGGAKRDERRHRDKGSAADIVHRKDAAHGRKKQKENISRGHDDTEKRRERQRTPVSSTRSQNAIHMKENEMAQEKQISREWKERFTGEESIMEGTVRELEADREVERLSSLGIISDRSVQETPQQRTIGINVPTPIIISPPTRRKIKDVTMVSEAVQTTPNLKSSEKSASVSKSSQITSLVHHHSNASPGGTRNSTCTDERKLKPRAGEGGLAWYIPVTDPRPWRKPLKERQAHAVSMDTWPAVELHYHSRSDYGSSTKNSRMDEDHRHLRLSLQDAFLAQKVDFISRSRERLKHVMLRAEERHIADLHEQQRTELFNVERRRDPTLDTHPYSENLYRPKKRSMSRKEMKELTNRKYATLAEVTRKEEENKRLSEYRANRVKALMFKQKVLNKLLHKKAAWVQ